MNERDIFLAAIEITDPARRAAYVEQACGSDATLRVQVEELLKTHAQSSQFLETPALAAESAMAQTFVTAASHADEDPHAERTSAEAEFRKYLQPATRAGWLGRLGHYEIEAILGRGAFGIVAKAFDEKLHRVVAIKLMNPALAATSPPRKRFLREARTAAAVTHENIVAIYAVEEEPIPYLVMEYIPGQTLEQWLEQHGPLEPAEILRIGRQVAAGLAAAHAANLIHRDIKPSNILLTGGAHERAKISDFGLARAVDDASMTQSGLIAGTPMYMAPEQAKGQTLDHRADLFSLGSVLYQMASGRPPFRAANTVAVLKRVCEDTPRPLDDVIPGIPGWLETVIFRLLEKDRDARYQTAQEVADLLAHCQSELQHQGRVTCVPGRPAAAETQVLPARTGNRSVSGRWPIGWLAGGVIAVVAVIGLVLSQGGRQTPEGSPAKPPEEAVFATAQTPAVAGWHGWPADAPKPAIAPFDASQAKKHQEEWAAYLKIPVEHTNSLGMKFRLIPPGEFTMGSTPEEIAAALKEVGENEQWQKSIQSETPQHKVILTQPIYLGVTEVTQVEYENVMGGNPSDFARMGKRKEAVANLETGNHPVETVSWHDAAEFCAKLSQQEKLKPFYSRAGEIITPLDGTGYRLPSEAEWEFACRAGTITKYWIGDKDEDVSRAGWFAGNSGGRTHVAGELKANPFGLFDLHGNVWEWVQDGWDASYYVQFSEKPATNPSSPFSAVSRRVVRGGNWILAASGCRSSARFASVPPSHVDIIGFRVSMPVDAVRQTLKLTGQAMPNPAATAPSAPATPKTGWHGWPSDAPPPAIAPFDAEQAKQHQAAWAKYLGVPVEYENSIGMKFRLIPPGEFLMGSTLAEIQSALTAVSHPLYKERIISEAPQHKVVLTQPIYLGVHEVTQSQYLQIMGVNPSRISPTSRESDADSFKDLVTTDYPVEMVSWTDAAEFCAKLCLTERMTPSYARVGETVTMLEGLGYRLPTEAEWEFFCRAGTTTKFWTGDNLEGLEQAAWFTKNARLRTHAVGKLKANPFGLYDVHGNVAEWVQDRWSPEAYNEFSDKPATNPTTGDALENAKTEYVMRGGEWSIDISAFGRSSARWSRPASFRYHSGEGFRVALPVDAVRQALKVDGPKMAKSGVSVGANGNPVAEQGRSAWDDLDPAQIPEAERVPRQPEGLVAVIGQHRRRFWGLVPSTMSVSQDGTQYSVTTEAGAGLYLFSRDPQQPAQVFNLDRQHPAATFLADGKIAVGDDTGGIPNGGGQLRIFAKPRDGMPLEKQTATNAQILAAMQASPNGEWLAGYERFEDGTFGIGLWKLGDAPPQRAVKFVQPGSTGTPRISFSPDGHWFCFRDIENTELNPVVHLIDLRSDPPREAIVLKAEADEKSDAPAKGFLHAAFLSDGRLATADRNGRIWFWKINDSEPLRVGSIRDSGSFAVAARSLRLIVGLGGTQFRVWDLAADPPQLLGSSPQFDSLFNTQTIAPNGETFLTGHMNGAVRFWGVSKAGVTELDPLASNPSFAGRQLKVIDRFLCASTEASRVGVWRPTPDGLQALPMESPSLLVVGASSAQQQLIVREPGAGGGIVLLRCDADRMSPIRRITGDNVASASLNNEGNRLAIGRENGTSTVLELWGWESDDLPARKLAEIKSPESVQQLAFVEAGRALVGRVGLRFQMWDVKDDQLIPRASLPTRQFNQFALAPDGQTLVTASYGNPLELWNLKSDLTQPTTSFAIPEANAVAFSPDGRRLAAAVFSKDGASAGVQIINLANGVVEKRLSFPGRVDELTFTDDSRHLITGNANATIYVVRLQSPPTK